MKYASINITIHNKGYLLPLTLDRLLTLTDFSKTEIVFVLDGCTDNSASIVNDFQKTHSAKLKIKVLEADNVFETKANNIAAKASEGDYIIILQDDVILNEIGWNNRLLKPFDMEDVFAVTGNTSHNWELDVNSIDWNNPGTVDNTRWCDLLKATHHANKTNTSRDTFAVRDTVNRAPLAIKHSDFKVLNYFDEVFAPLDSDDHDLCYRMHNVFGKVVGSYWIDWYSQPNFGGTRDENGATKQWVFEANNKNARILFERHNIYMQTKQVESRIIK